MIINGISLIILGIITVPTLFLPQKLANKIAPYKGYIGISYLILGILEMILCFLRFDLLSLVPHIWIIGILCSIMKINLGIMLKFNFAVKAVSQKNRKLIVNDNNYIDFILFKTTMGIISIGLGLCQIIACLIWPLS